MLVTHRIAELVRNGGFEGYRLEPVLEYGKGMRDAKVRYLKARYPGGPPALTDRRPELSN